MQQRPFSAPDEAWSQRLGRALAEQRQRAMALLESRSDTLSEVEAQLEEQIALIRDELAADTAALTADRAALQAQAAELERQSQSLRQKQRQVEEREAECQALHQQAAQAQQAANDRLRAGEDALHRQTAELEAAGEKLRHAQRSLAKAQEEHDSELELLARRRVRIEEQHRLLDEEREQLAARAAQTEAQRQRLADKLKVQQNKLRSEAARLRATPLPAASTSAAASEDQCNELARLTRQLEELTRRDQQRTAQLEARIASEAQLRAELEAASTELASFQELLDEAAHEAERRHQESQAALAARCQQCEQHCRELEQQQAEHLARVEGLAAELAARDRELAVLCESSADTEKRQIDQIRTLTAQVASLTEQSAKLKNQAIGWRRKAAEGEQALANQSATLTAQAAELDELRAAAAEAAKVAAAYELAGAGLRQQITLAEHQVAQSAAELEELRQELQRRSAAEHGNQELIDTLQAECDSLAAQLAKAASSGADTRKLDDMQRRFELAVEDVRDLKKRNAQLEEKLAQSKSSPRIDDGALDWESQKRRLLAALESDGEESPRPADRLTIEGTLKITDDVIAQKDREIADLQEMLSQQRATLGDGTGVGAAAISEILDTDEIIQQGRVTVSELEAEWREKLRRAEVDISVERARIARERVSLEEKLRALEEEKARVAKDNLPDPVTGEKKPQRGRWLSRLGLKDTDNP